MDAMIKAIRQAMGLSQQEFADLLGSSFTSVNRWENGRANPGRMAQKRLYELCTKRKIAVRELLVQKIQTVVDGLTVEPDRVILYHGSKSGINGKIAPPHRRKKRGRSL